MDSQFLDLTIDVPLEQGLYSSQPATALEAALGAGLPVHPVHPGTKRPILRGWYERATDDREVLERWFGRRGQFARYGVGLALRKAGLMAVDLDTPEAADRFDTLTMAHRGLFTWTIMSQRGAKYLFRRPEALANENGTRVHRPELGGADLLFGQVVIWMPDRSRYQVGGAGDIARCPGWLEDIVSAIMDEPKTVQIDCYPASDFLAPQRRARAFIRGLVGYWARRIGQMPADSGRGVNLYAAARTVAEYLHHAPDLANEVHQLLMGAAATCGYCETDGPRHAAAHIDRGLRDGSKSPRPLPERQDWSPRRVATR